MSSVVISGDTSGSVTLTVPAVAGTQTITLPAATGTVMVSGNMPAFSAYQNSAQTISTATFTKITFDTETFDTNNNFASSRFTPTVAGYYQINATVGVNITTATAGIYIFKNGSALLNGSYIPGSANIGNYVNCVASTLVYLNGSTDYVEVYVYQNSGSSVLIGAALNATQFNGSMVRGA